METIIHTSTSVTDELFYKITEYINSETVKDLIELHKYCYDFSYDHAKYVAEGVCTRLQLEDVFARHIVFVFAEQYDNPHQILTMKNTYIVDFKDGLKRGISKYKRDTEIKERNKHEYKELYNKQQQQVNAIETKQKFLDNTARHKKVRDEVMFNKLREKCWLHQEGKSPKLLHIKTAEAVRDYRNVRYYNDGSRDGCFIEFDEKKSLWQDVTPDTVNRYIDTFIGETSTDSLTRSVRQKLRSQSEIPLSIINRYSDCIPLANCDFNLNNYTPIERSANRYWTFATDYEYDKDATCPTIDENLWLYSCKDQSWIDAFWEMAGYCLTGDATFQVMFWVIGSGGNGKGTCDRIIQSLVGNGFTQSIKPEMLSNQFYLQYLINKRLGVISDLAITLDNIHIIKQLTGGDKMQTNLKFKNQDIQFVNECKLFFAMNKMPYIETSSIGAMKRRIQMFPFDYKIPTRDPAIERQMMSELSGAFNRAIEGLKRLRSNRCFTRIKRGDTLVDIWLGEMNTFAVWFNDSLVPDENAWLDYDNAWEAYKQFMAHYTGKSDWDKERGNVNSKHHLIRKIKENIGMLQERTTSIHGKQVSVKDKHTDIKVEYKQINVEIEKRLVTKQVYDGKGQYTTKTSYYTGFKGIRLKTEDERDAEIAEAKPYSGYDEQAGF